MSSMMCGMLLGAGVGSKKTYVDDVFSTFLYDGNDSTQSINNGIDLSAEGGLVWIKERDGTYSHNFYDTERGVGRSIYSNLNIAEEGPVNNTLTSFNSNGFSLGDHQTINDDSNTYSSWTFRKAPGFCDVVSYTGNGSVRTIAHSLGSVPGMIIVKNTSSSGNWNVYHRDTKELTSNAISPGKYTVYLDGNWGASEYANVWNNTSATSSVFTVGTDNATNKNGDTFVAYVFAGGESTAATATSCNFLGTSASGNYDNNKIFCGTTNGTKTADLVYGTGDFTWEAWVKCESSSNIYRRIFHHGQEWTNGTALGFNWDNNNNANQFSLWSYNLSSNSAIVHSQTHNFDDDGQWHHVAVSRQSGTFRIFVDGVLEGTNSSYSGSTEIVSASYCTIGATHNANVQECFKGNISNVRIVKGTAVYTSSFRPPTEPLTNITNTKLLCCNGSSVTSATVTPITLTVGDSSVTASTDSPFDDPAGFVFGENEDQNVIKCGSYTGSGSAGLEVNIGFEPQWLLIKATGIAEDWQLFDSMRGIVSGDNDASLFPNENWSETQNERLELTSTGFKLKATNNTVNGSNKHYVFLALRRPDGYVGKPPELGTGVFAMDTGNGSSSGPVYDSNFAVDWALWRQPASSQDWRVHARLTGDKELLTNSTAAEASRGDDADDDFNDGWGRSTNGSYPRNSNYQSWMWKRHAGFDVVAYDGDGVAGRQIPHSLNKSVEMIWLRSRSHTNPWMVYHKGLDGGTNPSHKYLQLNSTSAESDASVIWNDTAPTANHFTIGSHSYVNADAYTYLAMLFASVDGISKVGYYTGNGSTQTISTGFAPRFAIIRRTDGSEDNWVVLDTTRGWGSGNDEVLKLNSNTAESAFDAGAPTSTGFSLTSDGWVNYSTGKFIYYAHA